MLSELFTSENIVHVGAALYLAGFLFRSQVVLRSLIIVGDVAFTLYYYLAPETPLWGGVFWSVLFMVVNIVMVGLIIGDNVHRRLDAHERRLFDLLGVFTPGEFRKLMRLSRLHVAEARTTLTSQDQPLDHLYFVLDGDIAIVKSGLRFPENPGTFIGEIAFLLARAASATVTVGRGTRYFAWRHADLRKVLDRNAGLRNALGAAFNHLMALKVADAGLNTFPAGE